MPTRHFQLRSVQPVVRRTCRCHRAARSLPLVGAPRRRRLPAACAARTRRNQSLRRHSRHTCTAVHTCCLLGCRPSRPFRRGSGRGSVRATSCKDDTGTRLTAAQWKPAAYSQTHSCDCGRPRPRLPPPRPPPRRLRSTHTAQLVAAPSQQACAAARAPVAALPPAWPLAAAAPSAPPPVQHACQRSQPLRRHSRHTCTAVHTCCLLGCRGSGPTCRHLWLRQAEDGLHGLPPSAAKLLDLLLPQLVGLESPSYGKREKLRGQACKRAMCRGPSAATYLLCHQQSQLGLAPLVLLLLHV